jgi:NhaP-type Na+/H+ or K+/H+ antiporter
MSLAAGLAIGGAALLAIGLLSRPIERALLSTVLVATLIGILLGPEAGGLLDDGEAASARGLLEDVAAVTLAVALMATGLQITTRDLRRSARTASLLLSVGMLAMWALSGLGAWLLLDLPLWTAFLLGAVLTPTDPVIASVLVTSSMAKTLLPRRLRRTLQVEAGGNDGLALPLVVLAGLLATEPVGTALGNWAVEAVREVGIAVGGGLVLGLAAGWAVEKMVRRREIEDAHLIGLGIALALLAFGAVRLLDGSGILAVFVAALGFGSRLPDELRGRLEAVQEGVVKFFVLPAFILFGATVPWSDWRALGLPGAAFVAWILLLRRPVAVTLALRAAPVPPRPQLFLGWFGPLGIAAIYYAHYSERFAIEEHDRLLAAATLTVFCSIVIHSVTATPGVRLYAGRSPLRTLRHPFRGDEQT